MSALHKRYHPKTFSEVVGQTDAVAEVNRVLAFGWGDRAWWITGASGTGKSTLARLIALEGADAFNVEELDSQLLTPARLREVGYEMRTLGMGAKTGRAYIINEAHGLRKDTIRLLLTMLDDLPHHVVFVFTTTREGQGRLFEDDVTGDAGPLLSRCTPITLANDESAQAAFARRAREIAVAEGIDGVPESVYVTAASNAKGNMRSLLHSIESGAFKREARVTLEKQLAMIASTKGPIADGRRATLNAAIAALS